MEAGSLVVDRPHDSRRVKPRRSTRNPEQSRLRDDLVRAKKERRTVQLHLALETDYTVGDECTCKAQVEWVEPKSVLFTIEGRNIWIMEAYIVSVELLDA